MALIFIIISLSFHGRMHEFVILISVGEEKGKIILQLIGELLIPIILAIAISFSVSPLIAKTASDYIIDKNYEAIDRVDLMKSMSLIETNDTYNVNNIEQINNLDINLNKNNILIFSGGLLLILIVSTAIPIVKIVKLSPMKILQKKE
jgi:putative ABC transport system permease protein